MAYKKTLRLLFVAAITLIGLNLAPAFAATPGTWVGIAEFGTFDLEVNAEGTGIEKITYHFSSFSCGGVIISGSIGITPGTAWPISNDEFSIMTTPPEILVSVVLHTNEIVDTTIISLSY